jgi:aryl-alcohol dehydrogenase-like predicted oxidoreductase
VGYGVAGEADWTAGSVRRGIDEALIRLRTEVIDLVLLHSCPVEVLGDEGILSALDEARRGGKLRVVGYSGEGAPLDLAIRSKRFGAVECSVNVCDQGGLGVALPAATAAGLGTIAKRPLATAPWRHHARPERQDLATYWDRWQALRLEPAGLDWDDLAIRFAAHAPGVDCCIVGTRRLDHLRRAAEAVGRGVLPTALLEAVDAAYRAAGPGWEGVV